MARPMASIRASAMESKRFVCFIDFVLSKLGDLIIARLRAVVKYLQIKTCTLFWR